LYDHSQSEPNGGPARVFSPKEIAEQVGGIAVKSLNELIRKHGMETTTIGYAEPSRKGGPRRRLWGMTEVQLDALIALRRRGRHDQDAV
jgi:hypothetical protein